MKLVSLELENFRQHRDTRIDFLPGVTAIIGKNGSGKTTVLEAISWALYGGPAVRGKNETIRCRSAEGSAAAEVRLKFDLGPHTYTVIRRMETSKTIASLAIDGIPARTGFKEVTDAVTKLLGMDYQAFFTSFFTGQKELEFMRGMDGRARAAAISRMLGYERLVRARDRANQDKLGLNREIEALERGLGDPEEIKRRKAESAEAVEKASKALSDAEGLVEKAKKEVERLQPLKELSEQKSKRSLELTRRAELDSAEEKRAAARVAELKKQLDELAAKEEELKGLKPQLDEYRAAGEEFKKLSELQKHEARRKEILARLGAIDEQIKTLEARQKELEKAPEEFAAAAKALTELEKQYEETCAEIEHERNAFIAAKQRAAVELEGLNSRRAEIVEKRAAIQAAGSDGKCPTCERPLAEELPKVLAGFDEQISQLDAREKELNAAVIAFAAEPQKLAELQALRQVLERQKNDTRTARDVASQRVQQLKSCESELAAKREESAGLRKELETIPSGFDQERYTHLREVGDRLRPVWDKSIQLKAEIARRAEVESELNRERASLERVRKELIASAEAMKQLAFSQEEHDRLVAEFEQGRGALNAASIDAERARGDLKAAQAALEAAEKEEKSFKSRESELRQKRRDRVLRQTLAEAFDSLRNDLNNRAAPELAAASSEILDLLTDGRYNTLEVNEDYEAIIRDDGELKPIISGGEEDVVNLALRLAVSTMITDRAGQDLTLLILDEVFGSLDDIRRENVVNFLQALKNRFEQIIIITHIESVHDAVDNCVWVDYDESSKTCSVRMRDSELEDLLVKS